MLIKRIALLIMILILSLPASALAAEANSGVIEGGVLNKTGGENIVPDHDVNLKTYLNGAEVGSTTTRTDAEGNFTFDGLSTGPGYAYQVMVAFQGAEYYSDGLSFSEGETSKFTVVTVYDATTSDEAIKITSAHTIIYVGQGRLRVDEWVEFNNAADLTYTGSKVVNAEGDKETLVFSLPEGAAKLNIEYGLMECCIQNSEEGFIDTMAVQPGSKLIAYSYEIDYSSGEYEFLKTMDYPAASFIVLLQQGEGIEVSSDQLTVGQPVKDAEGMWFNYLSGSGFARGDVLTIHLSGLAGTDGQNTVIWVILALVVLAGGSSVVYLLKKKKPQPVSSPPDSSSQRKQGLLVELAELDDDFEAGKIPEENYRKLRKVKKSQLAELMQKPKGKRDNG